MRLVEQPREVHIKSIQYAEQQDHEPYVRVPIIQRNSKIGPIYHWVKESEAKKIYHGDKFNVEPDVINFSEEEYKKALPNSKWKYNDVKELFEMLRNYNLNFIVVHDRMTFGEN